MSSEPLPVEHAQDETIGLGAVLREISRESERLAEQCGVIQWSISAMLDIVDHPDLGAEIHMLQDIDRIQQTLADVAAMLDVTSARAGGTPIRRADIQSAIRLDSLRERLGLGDGLMNEAHAADPSDITWL